MLKSDVGNLIGRSNSSEGDPKLCERLDVGDGTYLDDGLGDLEVQQHQLTVEKQYGRQGKTGKSYWLLHHTAMVEWWFSSPFV